MDSASRLAAAWPPLLLAVCLSASAEGPVRPGVLAEADERTAEALAHAATGLVLSPGRAGDAAAIASLEEAIRLEPLARRPYRLLERRLRGPADARRRADLLAREARAFGTRGDWRRALSAAVAAEDEAVAREAVAALSAGVRAENATRDSAADLAASAIALCRLGAGADAVHPFRRYLALARSETLAPPSEVARAFAACVRAVGRAPADSAAERLHAASALFRLFRDSPLPGKPEERAEALAAGGAPFAASDDPAARALFREMALASLRLDPFAPPTALFVALEAADEGADGGDAPDASEDFADTLAKIDAFAARPEAAGLGHAFALAAAFAAAHRSTGPETAAATNALARAEALWAAERPGEPLPARYAELRFEILLDAGLGAEALDGALAVLPEDLRGLDPVFANNLAYTLACEGGDLDLAQRLADRSLAARPGSPETLDTVGWILHLQGQEEDALEMLGRAIKLVDAKDPHDADVFDHLGDVLSALGRDTEARAAWTHAAALAPTDERRAKLGPPAEPGASDE